MLDELLLTAVFQPVPLGYAAWIEEVPGAITQERRCTKPVKT